jgi:hypothetical protein
VVSRSSGFLLVAPMVGSVLRDMAAPESPGRVSATGRGQRPMNPASPSPRDRAEAIQASRRPPSLQDAGGWHVRIDGGSTSEELPHLIGWLTAV